MPVASAVPPVDAANQLMVPADAEADKFTVTEPQLAPGVVEVMLGMVFTVPATAVRGVVVQPPVLAST